MMAAPKDATGDVWYVYDGECPLCSHGGARASHP